MWETSLVRRDATVSTLRYWDYYNMTETFTDLYKKASNNDTFSNIYDIITSRENILLAFRTIKSNKGSKTPGTDGKTAQKWYHAVRLYLKERLKLDISPEKSQIVNLRKRKSEFLGFTIWAETKRNTFVAQTGVMDKKKQDIKKGNRERIKILRNSQTAQNAKKFNSFILGLHNYI